jgi:(+)-trans-carveol dehydrogenase
VLAKELAGQSIRVNTVHPTSVGTPMLLNELHYRLFRPDLEDPTVEDFAEAARGLNRMPIPWVEASDISETVLHLVADSGRYITGTTQIVDAGGQL